MAYAKRFLDEGAKVVIAEINEDRAASAMKQLEKLGEAAFVQTDISDEQSTLACAAKTNEKFGGIDILVNNAALYYDIDNENNDYEYLQKVFAVNLHGAWLMAKACSPAMVEQRWVASSTSRPAPYLYNIVPAGEFRKSRGSPTARRSGALSGSRSSSPPSLNPQHQADHDGRDDAEQRQSDQFFLCRRSRNGDRLAIIGLDPAFHQSRDPELPAHLVDDQRRRPRDGSGPVRRRRLDHARLARVRRRRP